MCAECGCSKPGPTRIDGRPADEINSPLLSSSGGSTPGGGLLHEHPHRHGEQSEHSHPHRHEPGHEQEHEHEHEHEIVHAHTHTHSDGREHAHPHTHQHGHEQEHQHGHPHQTLDIYQPILAANDRIAERNRGFFTALGLLAVNVVSSPGSGKTTLIQRTLEKLGSRVRAGVIVGDLETDNDARRLRSAGATAIQITTGTLCHLEASMVARAVTGLDVKSLDLLFIENVGNLVCPASFDLGEDLRVTLLSATEGEDKPLKYPPIFHSAHAVVINKIDLAAAADFNRETALANIRRVAPGAEIFELSAKTGTGLDRWCDFLLSRKTALGQG